MRFTAKQFGAVIISVTLSFTNFLPIVYFQRQVLAQGVSDRRREKVKELIAQRRREKAERLIRQGNKTQNNSNSNFNLNKEDPCSMLDPIGIVRSLKKEGIQFGSAETEDLLQHYLREDNLIDAYLLLEDRFHSGPRANKDFLLVLADKERIMSDGIHKSMEVLSSSAIMAVITEIIADTFGVTPKQTLWPYQEPPLPLPNLFTLWPYLAHFSSGKCSSGVSYEQDYSEILGQYYSEILERKIEILENEQDYSEILGQYYGEILEREIEILEKEKEYLAESSPKKIYQSYGQKIMNIMGNITREDEKISEKQKDFQKIKDIQILYKNFTSELSRTLDRKKQIQAISKTQNSFIVQYFITYTNNNFGSAYEEEETIMVGSGSTGSRIKTIVTPNEEAKLLISVISPHGEITIRQVDLQSIDTPIKDIIPELRRTIHSRGNNKDESPFQEGDTVKKKNDPYDDASYTIKSIDTEKREVHLVDLLKPLSFDEVKKIDPTIKTNLPLQKLHGILIDPIADLLPQDPNEQVIFIPHKELFFVPFPALQDKEGKYLIEKHTITTAPAIQVLDLTRKQKQRIAAQPKQDVLVVGNPSMPTSKFSSEPLPSLPHAESEAKAVAQYYNTKALIGDQGTEAAIASQLANYRIIHFATHGIFNQIEPLESSIVLAPDDNEDGFLTAADFLNMELNAELIVLSACDTGKGRITGEGVVGLSRSLAIAGIPSILVSLWKIDDESTKELMLEFYKNLEQGNNKAQSLRQAMLTMMKKYGVYHWGAFNLIGEAE